MRSPLSQLPKSSSVKPLVHEQFLRLEIEPPTQALLPVYQLSAVLKVPPAQIAPIPHLPAWVMGVYNWRGQILWTVDLAHLMGLSPWYHQRGAIAQLTTVVFNPYPFETQASNLHNQLIGLAVHQVTGIEAFDPGLIRRPSTSADLAFAKFLHGYWMKANDDVLAVLDGAAIIAAMPKR